MTVRKRRVALSAAVIAAAVLGTVPPREAAAQSFRGWSTTTVRYAELRPVAQDTVSEAETTPDAQGRLRYEGDPVSCVPGIGCFFYRALPTEHALLASQEVGLTAWGFGVEGLSFTTLLRSRAQLDGAFDWPRGDDHFDALLAYAQLNRGRYRVRLGRQDVLSGLGSTAFDGLDVLAVVEDFRLQLYGGRSLARGLAEPRNEALRGLQDLLLDQEAYLIGGSARYRAPGATSVGLRYQREIWEDRSGLVSERGSLDFRTGYLRPLRVDGSADYDFGFGRLGKAHLSLAYPLWNGRTVVELTGRRYVPYFELSTIWGFFMPVAYHEAELRGTWAARPELGMWAAVAYRTYEDHEAPVIVRPLEDRARRASVGGRWSPRSDVALDATYRLEWNPGAFLSAGDLAARWSPDPRLDVTATVVVFQQIDEFRVGEGTAVGGGLSAQWEINDRIDFGGGLSVYRHANEGRSEAFDWNQVRGWSALRVEIGEDPGLARARSREP